eukprot:scaffold2691_cov417-Prasinococcus_capsulatus_cf.AAC.14
MAAARNASRTTSARSGGRYSSRTIQLKVEHLLARLLHDLSFPECGRWLLRPSSEMNASMRSITGDDAL